MKTELHDRTLWYDGTVSVDEDQFISRLFRGLKTEFVNEMTNSVQLYNNEYTNKLHIKSQLIPIQNEWNTAPLSEEDLVDYIKGCFYQECHKHNFTADEKSIRMVRIRDELYYLEQIHKIPYLCALIDVINKLKEAKVGWNGRGSSAASYILYLIGVHRVDSVKYDIDPKEFFKNIS